MAIKLDPYQIDVLKTEGNLCLRSGRQVGKSTIISIKAAEYAAKNPKKTILIISSVERQARLLFEKTLAYLHDNYKSYIKTGKDRPTMHIVNLKNGSRIYCLPTGLSGYGIRGYTVDMLIADEAAFISEEVWQAVTPMLATTKGNIILLSTPFGRSGYFYRCFSDPAFTSFHVSSEDCARIDKDFLVQEKKRMSAVEYAQEYLGEFVDELMTFFPEELIKSCMTIPTPKDPLPTSGEMYMGADIGGMGGDQTVLLSVSRTGKRNDYSFKQIDMDVSDHTRITETIRRIKKLDRRYYYKKMYIDSGGLGVGVTHPLLDDDDCKRRVVEINNASRTIDYEKKRRRKLIKEDLYSNLINLMEQGKIALFDDPEILLSLKSVQIEKKDGKTHIFGKFTHIAEALCRSVWGNKDKTLNIWCR